MNENKLKEHFQHSSNYSSVARPMTYKDAVTLKADTGASGHYLANKDKESLGITKLRTTKNPKLVQLPTNAIMSSTHDAELNIPQVSPDAKQPTVFPAITSSSLLSIGQLCDDNCTAI